jgi:hypothetical protein
MLATLTLFGGGRVTTSFDALMYGIGIQETGGNGYHTVNSIGAVGKYQVMKANIPSWSKKVLGYSISWQKFRDSPNLQEQIVRGILKGYYNKYGAKGAASMWYSGQPNYNKTYGNPPVYKYVNSVISHSTKYTGGSASSSSSSATYSGTGSDDPLSSNELAESYGFVDTLMDSNPELKKLFSKAVKGQWTADKFQAELRDTKWWKTHSESERKYLTNRYGDPATAKQDLNQSYVHVRQLAAQMGMVETPANMKKLNLWAYNMTAKGWDDAQLRNEIGKYVFFGDKIQGEGKDVQDKLHSYAYNMGVTMSGQWYADNTRKVLRGLATEGDYEDEIRKQAKAMYSGWSKQIDAGQTVADLASPYLSSMSQILELPSGSVSLQDSTIKKALQYKDKTTGKNVAKPLWQFENDLRNDPRWKKTKNAQDSLMQVAHQVLADFGLKT